MNANHELWLTDSLGNRLEYLEAAREFSYTHATHSAGFFSVTLPGTFPREQLSPELGRRVCFFRKPTPNAVAALDFVGFVRRVHTTGARENKQRIVQGYSPNWLLGGRIVFASAGSAGASKTAPASNMIKAIVREQMGALAAAARQYNALYFSVQADDDSGPEITKAFAYRNVLDVARDLSDVARQAGDEVFFHVKTLGVNRFVLVTSAAQLGQDLRTSGLVFSDENDNLDNPSLTEDWENEFNFGYGLGDGEKEFRDIQTAEATDRSGATWYARREIAKDARNQATGGALAAAQSGIIKGRPMMYFSGDIRNTEGALYGANWNFGDRLRCSYDGRQFDSLVRAVTVGVNQDGEESVSAKLEAYF